jgi:phage head maturation protease
LEVFAAPFARLTRVVDVPPNGDGKPYVEELVRGCFESACADPFSVELDRRHTSATIGHAEDLEERADGLHGRFVLTGSRREVARTVSAVRAGDLGSASVEFIPIDHRRSAAGVVRRDQANRSRSGS